MEQIGCSSPPQQSVGYLRLVHHCFHVTVPANPVYNLCMMGSHPNCIPQSDTKSTPPLPQIRERAHGSNVQSPVMTEHPKPAASEHQSASSVIDTIANIVLPILDYLFSILRSTLLLLLRQPISWLLGLYLFVGILTLSCDFLTSSVYTALSPICRLPGSSFLPLCTNQGRWEEAEIMEVQVMETKKRVLGEEHPDTLTSMVYLASKYRNQGQWEEAKKLELQVIETWKRVLRWPQLQAPVHI